MSWLELAQDSTIAGCSFCPADFMERIVTPALRLLLTIWLQAGHCGTQNLYLYLIGDAKLHGITFQPYDRAEQSPRGDNFIAIFQGVDHFLGLLLATLRGENQQDVENTHDDDQRQERHQASRAAGLGHQGKI